MGSPPTGAIGAPILAPIATAIVTATADNDVNVFITSVTKTTVTVEVSQANYVGNVFIQAIEKGC